MNHHPWWQDAVIYQIYPRSFCDSNGDGVGDIPGIVSRLDHLQTLGVDAVWLSPVFRSPQDDNGYDISDYRDIDPLFGTMEEMDRLIREAGARGIRIVMDLVLNHSSDEHPWFLAAKSSRESPYHDYYIWRDRPEPPLRSGFGGSAWEWVPEIGQYYFHHFSRKQPDLNWANPALRQELYAMIRFWADRGIGGFRLDVVDHLGKEIDRSVIVNGPRLHDYLREMSAAAFQGRDLVTVGEAWSADLQTAPLYSNPDGSELSMVFQFEHLTLDQMPGDKWTPRELRLPALKEVLSRWQTGLRGRGWNSLFWENHDVPRIVSRWGDDREYRVECAKMFAILLFGFQGTPYIYQGQELGMTNAAYPIGDYRDIELKNAYAERTAAGLPEEDVMRSLHRMGRDNARTPMQWDAGPGAGFTAGTPWLRINPNHGEINAESQVKDPDSVFSCYRQLIRLRKEHAVFREGDYTLLLPEDEDIFAYVRETEAERLLVVCNFHGETIPCPAELRTPGETLIRNYPDIQPEFLRPYEARMILTEKKED